MAVRMGLVEVTYSTTIRNIVAGRIVEMVRHTNSDHMWVCQVDVGGDAPIQIVTGAQNQQVGDLVPIALDGALLPDGKEIHAGTLRGEASNGMMCSLKELGLTLHDYPYAIEDGLWILQEDGVKPVTTSPPSSARTTTWSSLRSRPTARTACP